MQLKINIDEQTSRVFTAQLRHVREYKTIRADKLSGTVINKVIAPKCGVTVLAVTSETHPLPRIYTSRCHPEDHYKKSEGILRCLDELVKDFISRNASVSSYQSFDGGKSFEVTLK